MKIKDESLSSLNEKGIYSITHDSGKRYVGSTKKSFVSRMKTHVGKLQCSWHQNDHLQSAWNKYGTDSFTFEVLEVIEDNELVRDREEYWIKYHDAANRAYGYNINAHPDKSPILTPESIEKMRNTLKTRYANGEIPLNAGNFKKGIQVWNKGKKYKSTDHLKVPKTITEKFLNKYKNDRERRRSKMLPIEVYCGEKLIGIWDNAKVLEEYSLTAENTIPVNSKFKAEMRRGKPRQYLNAAHINIAYKTNTLYKGLIFKFKIPGPTTE